jgi:putative tryptophan/tyrosine transport system substrate-binding protein
MKRREFITLLGGVATSWPFAALAQQAVDVRRIGVLTNAPADDPEFSHRLGAFVQELERLGWTDGGNLRIEYRWAAGDANRVRNYAMELVMLAPDVILASGGTTVGPLQLATHTVPIVFVQVPDPVGAGFVTSLARPGGNATGFTQFEYGISAKRLQVLKQVAPRVSRAAVLRDRTSPDGIGQFAAMQGVAPSLGVELSPVDVQDASEIEHSISTFARGSDGGLFVTASALNILHRKLIIMLAARHRIPAIYPYRFFVSDGGLIAYGPDTIDPYLRAASYVNRILKGEKPANLPVQHPTKVELVVNLKTANALGLDIPPTLLARADEVIE